MAIAMRSNTACAFARSDSEDSEDDNLIPVSSAYQSLDIRRSLQCPERYRGAVSELQAILGGCYKKGKTLDKSTRTLIEDDVRYAIKLNPGGEFNCKALKSLMVAVERALPQAKRQALSREHRQQMVQTQRATRRQRRSQGSCSNGLACSDYFTDVFAAVVEEEGEEMCPSFADLPKQCMETIFSTLDPISLATAVCVCTTWRQLAISDELWRPLRDLTFGAEASAELPENVTVTASAYESFSLLAHEHSEWLLPWRSGKRVCCHGAVRVIAPQTWERILAAPGPAGIAWNKSIGVAFMTPTEVVVWLDRRDGKVLEQVNSQWKHREAARLRARTKQTRHRRGQPGADGGE